MIKINKILYLTGTDWFWSKQRPQFLAETLSDYYNLIYVFHKTYRVENISSGTFPDRTNLKIFRLFRLPYNRFSFVRFTNKLLTIIQLLQKVTKSDIVWISHPDMFSQLKWVIGRKKIVIYDCVDDHLEFPAIKKNSLRLIECRRSERDLIARANHVFVTADYLQNKLTERYKVGNNFTLLNNGISSSMLKYRTDAMNHIFDADRFRGLFKIVYTGTVSEWFDFELLKMSVERFSNIIFILIGPTEVEIPNCSNIVHLGPVPHEHLRSAFYNADALIMPFVPGELVYSVNPVKLYEYIFSNKPAIIPLLPETTKFAGYVYLYETRQEFLSLIEKLTVNKLPVLKSPEVCESFTNENVWEKRTEKIREVLLNIESEVNFKKEGRRDDGNS